MQGWHSSRAEKAEKVPLPTALLINAQSLRAKTDKLSANTHYLHKHWSACVLAITET